MNWANFWSLYDWEVYRQAAIALLHGVNPYSVGEGAAVFRYPIWSLILVLPFVYLPYKLSWLIAFSSPILTTIPISRYFKMGRWGTVAFATSAFTLNAACVGNMGIVALLGLLFPTPIALFFLMIKPQATSILMLVLVLKEWDAGGWRRVVRSVAPVGIALGLSVIVFGLPRLPASNDLGYTTTVFPWSLLWGIPVGLYALWKRSVKFGSFASPFISPFVTYSGFTSAAVLAPGIFWVISYAYWIGRTMFFGWG